MVVGPIVIFIAAGMGAYLGSYLRRKGENVATKEDAAAITREVEGVKHELARRGQVHRLTSEREFQILSELYAALFEVMVATQELRPEMERFGSSDIADSVKLDRLNKLTSAWHKAADVMFRNDPFYPYEIQLAVRSAMEIAVLEAQDYGQRAPSDPGYWESRAKNVGEIGERVQAVCDAIRRHYSKEGAGAAPLEQGADE